MANILPTASHEASPRVGFCENGDWATKASASAASSSGLEAQELTASCHLDRAFGLGTLAPPCLMRIAFRQPVWLPFGNGLLCSIWES